jgi:hypothetical protein
MEKKLKLSEQLSFRGWPADFVAQLLKLEKDHEELREAFDYLYEKNKELENDLRIRIETDRRQTGNDPQPLNKQGKKSKA